MNKLNLYKIGSNCDNNIFDRTDKNCECIGKNCLSCDNYDYYSIYSEIKEIRYLKSEPVNEIKEIKIIDHFYHASNQIDKKFDNTVKLDFKAYKIGGNNLYCKSW